ncbi:hypothetical protein [Actinosynnema sp. ALI-1.44]|uniref:hypothetical protein n=1 Tax=Actinosynnema sp. ALI-1.44 TaxID=1933779 RepID=UPI0018754BC4
MRRLHLSPLLGLVRCVLVLGLRMSDVQPRGVFVQLMLGFVRQLHLRRLQLPDLRTRSVIRHE